MVRYLVLRRIQMSLSIASLEYLRRGFACELARTVPHLPFTHASAILPESPPSTVQTIQSTRWTANSLGRCCMTTAKCRFSLGFVSAAFSHLMHCATRPAWPTKPILIDLHTRHALGDLEITLTYQRFVTVLVLLLLRPCCALRVGRRAGPSHTWRRICLVCGKGDRLALLRR